MKKLTVEGQAEIAPTAKLIVRNMLFDRHAISLPLAVHRLVLRFCTLLKGPHKAPSTAWVLPQARHRLIGTVSWWL